MAGLGFNPAHRVLAEDFKTPAVVAHKLYSMFQGITSQVAQTNVKVVTITVTPINELGSPTGPLNMNGFQIVDMADPTAPQDAATQHYVDTSVASATVNIGAPVSGGIANDVLVIGAGGYLAQIAPGASGNGLVSDGTVWTSNPVSFDGGLF